LSVPQFLNAITFAMVAFIGIESISQGAEETKDPEGTIPKAHKTAVLSVLIFAIVISVLSLGIVDWSVMAAKANIDNPLVPVVRAVTGAPWLLPLMAFAGFVICLVSSNTGVIGVSRVAYSMSQAGLLSRKFSYIHPRFHTPWFALLFFTPFAIALAIYGDIYLLGELYAFGALTAYTLSNLSLILLRDKEPDLKRPYKAPLNLRLPSGKEMPLVALFGLFGCVFILSLLLWLHDAGRLLAVAWFVVGAVAYPTYKAYREHVPAQTHRVDTKLTAPALLVPVRGRTSELVVLDAVADLAKELKTKVVLLHLIELPASLPLNREILIAMDNETKDRLDALKTSLEARGVKAVLAVRNARSQSGGTLEYIADHTHVVGVYANPVALPPVAVDALREGLHVPLFEPEHA
jgi:APA family basic amino acid/polyamine antiporter